jgi:hypothetical protein
VVAVEVVVGFLQPPLGQLGVEVLIQGKNLLLFPLEMSCIISMVLKVQEGVLEGGRQVQEELLMLKREVIQVQL